MWKAPAKLWLFVLILWTPSCVGWTIPDVATVDSSLCTMRREPFLGIRDDNRSRLSRRESLAAVFAVSAGMLSGLTAKPTQAVASEVRAPVELLRPATRVKLYIDDAVKIATNKAGSPSDTLEALSQFFAGEPPVFMTVDETKLSRRYLEVDTSSAWQNARRKEREARGAERGIDYTTPYDRVNTAFEQWGEKRQFQILRSRQKSLERSNTIRAALNAYTNNLVFGNAYQLNVQGDAKKALVRNDALPDVNAVVVSDLDLRDLIRNQVLQNMDDARAELEYQVQSGDVDVQEIVTYLQQAQSSCQEWFSFIPAADVQQALDDVKGVYRLE